MRGFDLAELLTSARVEVWVGAGAEKRAVLCAAQLFLFLVINNPSAEGCVNLGSSCSVQNVSNGCLLFPFKFILTEKLAC